LRLYALVMRKKLEFLRRRFFDSKKPSDLAILLSILFISLAYLVQFAFNPVGSIQGDSAQYGAVKPRDWDLLSFTGRSLRNWPPVLLYLTFQSDVVKVLFQFLISFVSAMIMLMQINSQFKGKTRLLLFVLFSSLITTPQIINWNSVLLSESLLLSVTLLFMVSLRAFVLSRGKLAFWPLLMTTYLWCILKTTNIVVLILIFFSLLLLTGVRILRVQFHKSNFLRAGGTIAVLGVLLVALINQPNQEFNRGINYRTYAAVAALTDVNPRAAALHAELSKVNELKCLEIGNPRSYEFYASKLGGECQESKLWISENFYKWYAQYLLSHPQEALQLAAVGFIAGTTPVSLYAPNLSILPKPLQDLFFGERNFALRNLGFQPYGEYETKEYDRNGMEVVVPILAWLGIAFSLRLILVSRKQLRGILQNKAVKLDFILIAAGVAGVTVNSIAVPTEWFRENVYFFALIYISLIFLIGDLRESLKNREVS
jgi:hypothetical protein